MNSPTTEPGVEIYSREWTIREYGHEPDLLEAAMADLAQAYYMPDPARMTSVLLASIRRRLREADQYSLVVTVGGNISTTF